MISDILQRICAGVIGLFMAYMAFYSLVIVPDMKTAAAFCGFTVFMFAIGFSAHQRLKRLKESRRVFLLRFEGRSIEDALSIARVEALPLSRGLVAEKVNIPFERWFAYEIAGFQFVLASDEQGQARAFPLGS